ncbi:hypothetical protein [Roseibium sp. Sym1]|uniref:hypothetical protein n=1 Tax=Roseibium sp. Sym1 TaxID=3016006 RepID=UPI0022B5D652|nr:hypothetical protein [Roseibium sp. Sym1]
MSAEDTIPEEFEGVVTTAPSFFRIFFAAITPGGALEYKEQTQENGGYAADFTQLTQTTFKPAPLNASSTQEGYVALLAADGTTGNLTYIRESRNEDAPERFAPPQDLGKPDGVPDFLDTVLINGVTGRQNVFVTSSAAGNAIWWKFQNVNTVKKETVTVVPPGTETPVEITVPVEVPPSQPWADWQQLPGGLCSITACQNADGRIILAGINADSVPYMNMQSSDRPLLPEGWLGWKDIAGGLSGFEQLVCGIDGNALVHVFARIGSKIYIMSQTEVGAYDFTGWALFASFDAPVQTMTVSVSSNDGLYLAAQVGSGADSPVYAKYQTGGADNNWSAPQIIAHVANDSALVLQPNADTTLSLFALETGTGDAAVLNQISLAHWSAAWTPLGGPLAAIALTQDVTPNPS